MIKRLFVFCIEFAISCLAGFLGLDQGKAFLIIDVIYFSIVIIITLIMLALAKQQEKVPDGAVSELIRAVYVYLLKVIFSWLALKVLGVDFFVAFELITLGRNLWPSDQKANTN